MPKPYLDRQRAELHLMIERIGLWEARQVLESMENEALNRIEDDLERGARAAKNRTLAGARP